MVCGSCDRDIKNGNESVKCSECGVDYHVTCCRIRTSRKLGAMSASAIASWKCDKCADGGSTHSQSDNDEPMSIYKMFEAVKNEVSASRKASDENFKNLDDKLESLRETINDTYVRLKVVEDENQNLKNKYSDLATRNENLTRRVFQLEMDLSDMQQYSRVNNIEVRGIPLTPGEDVYNILAAVTKALGITFVRQEVSVAHRLPAPRDRRFQPSIVVQFLSRTTKAAWLSAARAKKISTTDVSPHLRPAPVFLNEHLTPHNKAIIGRAKHFVRKRQLAFAWSRDGKLFVRKTPESPAVRVWSMGDVEAAAAGTDGAGNAITSRGGGGSDGGSGGDNGQRQ